jgi:hypothetical protein
MRQPCLGPIEWLEAQKKNTKKKTGGKKWEHANHVKD